MNLNNIEFEFMISGECLMRKQYHINSGTEKLILELSDINSIVAYQTWSSDTLLLNNKKRVVFSMLPENFYDVVKNYNAKYPDGKYMPTCVLKAGDEVMYMNVIDIYLNGEMMMDGSGSSSTDLDCLCSGGHSFSRGSLIMVADNNFTHLGKSVDGERISMNSFIDQNEVRSMNVNINLSALPYSDIDYNLEDRVYHPFMKIHRSHHFTKPAAKNTNRYKYHTYLTLHETLRYNPIEMPPQRTYNYIINDDAVIKQDIGGRYLVFEDPKMITAYQDWTKETRSFGQGKRLLHTIPAGDFVTEVAKINSHLKMARQPMQPYKFTPTAYLEIKYPDKTVKTLAVISHVQYVMNTARADGQYSSNVTPQLIIRLNEYQMVDQEGNYISDVMRSNGEKVHIFMNIDDTPTKDYTDDNKSVSSINSKDLRSVYLNLGLVSLARLDNLRLQDMRMFLGFDPDRINYVNDEQTNDPASSDQAVNSTFQISTPDLDTLLSNNRSSRDTLGDKLLKGPVVANNKFASLNKKIVKRSGLSSKKRDASLQTKSRGNNIGDFRPDNGANDMRIYVKVSHYNDDPNKPKYHFLLNNDEPMTDQNMTPNFGLTEGYDYIFDQSDESNGAYGLLSFTNDWRSLVNDQLVLNRYTRGVQYVGNPGRDNLAYVRISVNKNTKRPLYYYANKGTGARQMGIQEPNSTNPNISPALVSIVTYRNPTNTGLTPTLIGIGVGAGVTAVAGIYGYRRGLSRGGRAVLNGGGGSNTTNNPAFGDEPAYVRQEAAKQGARDVLGGAGEQEIPTGPGYVVIPADSATENVDIPAPEIPLDQACGQIANAGSIVTPNTESDYGNIQQFRPDALEQASHELAGGSGYPILTPNGGTLPKIRPGEYSKRGWRHLTDDNAYDDLQPVVSIDSADVDEIVTVTFEDLTFAAGPGVWGKVKEGDLEVVTNEFLDGRVELPRARPEYDQGLPLDRPAQQASDWSDLEAPGVTPPANGLASNAGGTRGYIKRGCAPPPYEHVPPFNARTFRVNRGGDCEVIDAAEDGEGNLLVNEDGNVVSTMNSLGPEPGVGKFRNGIPKNQSSLAESTYFNESVNAGEDAANATKYLGETLPSNLADGTTDAITESAAETTGSGFNSDEIDGALSSKDIEKYATGADGAVNSDIQTGLDNAKSTLQTEASASEDSALSAANINSAIETNLISSGVASEQASVIANSITGNMAYSSATTSLTAAAKKGASDLAAASAGEGWEAGPLEDAVNDFANSFDINGEPLSNAAAADDLSNAMNEAADLVTPGQVNDILASKGITDPTKADITAASKQSYEDNLNKILQDKYGGSHTLKSDASLEDIASDISDTTVSTSLIDAVASSYEASVTSIIDKFSGELAASEFTSDSAQKILQGLQDPPASLNLAEATAQMNGKITDAVKSAIENTQMPLTDDALTPEGLSEYSDSLEDSINEELTTSFGTWTTVAGEDISVSALEGVGDDAASEAAGAVAKGAGEDAGSIIADLFG